jgi:uncharacterized protein YmfQ (DUF2313 family)
MRPTLHLPLDSAAKGGSDEPSVAGDFARHLALLMGTGVQARPGSFTEADLLALGGALRDARATNLAILDEAFPDTVDQLLAEWEAMYGLPTRADLTTAQRRDRLVAKVRAARAGTPADILTAVHKLDPTATITEYTAAAVAGTNPRSVFRFVVVLASAVYDDADLRGQIERLLDQMKPAHTAYSLAISDVFRWDDAATPWDDSTWA